MTCQVLLLLLLLLVMRNNTMLPELFPHFSHPLFCPPALSHGRWRVSDVEPPGHCWRNRRHGEVGRSEP